MLLLGAISLNLCVIGALLRPFVSRPTSGEVKGGEKPKEAQTQEKPKETQTQILKEKIKANGICSVENLKQVHKNNTLSGSVNALDNVVASRGIKLNAFGAKSDKYVVDHEAEKIGIFNFCIFKNISYQLLCFNNLFMCFGLSIVYVHLSAYASTTGISSNLSALLISVIGASNFLGRIAFGILGHV